MSDERLRALQRRWTETGSPDDEAAYLRERVRVGDLTRERLELAAYCGHEAARRAVGVSEVERLEKRARSLAATWRCAPEDHDAHVPSEAPPLRSDAHRRGLDWFLGVAAFGHEAAVRAALAAADRVRGAWAPGSDGERWRTEALAAFDAAREWVSRPDAEHLAAAQSALSPRVRLERWRCTGPEPRLFFAGPCYSAAEAVVSVEPEDQALSVLDACVTAARVIAHDRGGDHRVDHEHESAELMSFVRASLIRWAPGLGVASDPPGHTPSVTARDPSQ